MHPPSKESAEEGSIQNFDEIDVTIARNPINSNNTSKLVGIRTYLSVQAWSEWTIGEDEFNFDLGHIQLEYVDESSFADHEGFIVSSNNGNSNSLANQITEIKDIWVWDQPGSQFMATDISNTPRYLMLKELHDGDQATIDLANFQNMSSRTLTLSSSNPTQFNQWVYGRTTGSEGGIWLNYFNNVMATGSTAEIYYPTDAFQEYEVDILSTYDSDNGVHHFYTREIPDQVKKLTGGVTLQNNSPDNLQLTTVDNNFDEFKITSSYEPVGGDSHFWFIYGPPDRSTLSYPVMGEFFTNSYPSFDKNSFTVSSIELFEYPKLQNGYREANRLLYENGGQSFYEAITEFVRYWEFVSNSSKTKRLTDIHQEKLKDPRFNHPNRFDVSRSIVNDR